MSTGWDGRPFKAVGAFKIMSSKHFPFLSTIVTITVAIYAEIAKGPGKRIPKLLILIIILYH